MTAETGGGKAAALGAMLRAGLPVPDGFVVPFAVHRAVTGDPAAASVATPEGGERVPTLPLPATLLKELQHGLELLGDPLVAVRSSAADEDSGGGSAAGQYDSVLGLQGVTAVAGALRLCWASLCSARATAYRTRVRAAEAASGESTMAVIVQRHLDAEVSGVLFTPADAGGASVIESAWGLGASVMAGTVAPDTSRVAADGTVDSLVGDKRTRLDRTGTQFLARAVPVKERQRPTLDEATAAGLAALGERVASLMGGPQDVEWCIAEGRVWLLQARPVTVAPPPRTAPTAGPATLTGTPGSQGTASGPARTVQGADDFAQVRRGDILVCPFTDPAWTPLLRIAAGVVTETGGALSHAAIVAREHGIPAVLGVPDALRAIPDGITVTIDGTAGTVTISSP